MAHLDIAWIQYRYAAPDHSGEHMTHLYHGRQLWREAGPRLATIFRTWTAAAQVDGRLDRARARINAVSLINHVLIHGNVYFTIFITKIDICNYVFIIVSFICIYVYADCRSKPCIIGVVGVQH